MKRLAVLVFPLLLVVLSSCKRSEKVPPGPATATTTTTSTAVQDLSTADAKLQITPVPPPFVRGTELTIAGKVIPEQSEEIEVKATPLRITAQMNAFPDGLMLRYEVLPGGSEEPIATDRKAPDATTRTTVFDLSPQKWKKGSYEIKLWSGGDLVFSRKVKKV